MVCGCELVGCACVFDERGNFSPSFDDRIREIEADQVILAIGQDSDLSFINPDSTISTQRGLIVVDQATLETGMPGVFAGGDVVKVPGAIIHAIAAGRKAASSIDRLLGGDGNIQEILFQPETPSPSIGKVEGFAYLPREKVPELTLEERHKGFAEVAIGFDTEHAIKEASRCLQCDLRLQIQEITSPPEKLLKWGKENIQTVPESEGVYQLRDADKQILSIKGVMNMKDSLLEEFEENDKVVWFEYEEDQFYSKRESELLQQYIAEHGEMPEGNRDLDDLF